MVRSHLNEELIIYVLIYFCFNVCLHKFHVFSILEIFRTSVITPIYECEVDCLEGLIVLVSVVFFRKMMIVVRLCCK